MSKENRGVLTIEVANKATELFGRDITIAELRLMPYVQYLMVNEQSVNFRQLRED